MENATSPNTQDKGARRASFVGSVLTSLSTRLVNHLALGAACFGLGDGLATLPQAKAAGTAPRAAGGVVSPSTDVVTLTTNIPNIAIRPTQFKSAKEAVDFYRLYVLPATLNTAPLEWDGNIGGSNWIAGTISQAHLTQMQTLVNAYRGVAGVDGNVVFYDKYNKGAQQAAMIMAKSDILTHTITPGHAGYTPEAAEAAAHSNLCNRTTPSGINSLMGDHDVPSVGHRKWILQPGTMAMGLGTVPTSIAVPGFGATALWVFGSEPYNNNPEPPRDFFEFQSTAQGSNLENQDGAALANDAKGFHAIAWPPKGYVPATQVVIPTQWSIFGAQGRFDFSNSSVTMAKGSEVPANARLVHTQVDRVVWKYPSGFYADFEARPETPISVAINGIREYQDDSRSGAFTERSISYQVIAAAFGQDSNGEISLHTLSKIEKSRYDRDSGSFTIEATLTPGHRYQLQFNEGDLGNPGAWFDYGSSFTATAASHEIIAKLTGELLEGGNKGGSKLWIRLVDKTQQQ